MKSLSVLAALVSLATLSSAAAITVEKRTDTGVYLCNLKNWQGYCVHITAPSGTCVPLGSDLNNLVSSAGPDQGNICYFFVNPNCDDTAPFFHYEYPGVPDLSAVAGLSGSGGGTEDFDNAISSYRCTLL